MDTLGGQFSIFNGHDGGTGSGHSHAVATREYARNAGLMLGINSYESICGIEAKKRSEWRLLLADGFHDLIRRNQKFRTMNEFQRLTAGSIASEPNAGALKTKEAPLVSEGLDGLREELELDALTQCKPILVWIGAHLLVGPPVDDGDSFRTQTPGDGGAIDGRVPRPDHHHVLPHLKSVRIQLALLDVPEAVSEQLLPVNA